MGDVLPLEFFEKATCVNVLEGAARIQDAGTHDFNRIGFQVVAQQNDIGLRIVLEKGYGRYGGQSGVIVIASIDVFHQCVLYHKSLSFMKGI